MLSLIFFSKGITYLLVYRTDKYKKLTAEVEKDSKKCEFTSLDLKYCSLLTSMYCVCQDKVVVKTTFSLFFFFSISIFFDERSYDLQNNFDPTGPS